MSDVKLGDILTGGEGRDAVHVAIAPLTAGQILAPGQHVGLLDEDTVGPKDGDNIGIVDPFIKGYVAKGERCYVFLYPNTVTSLRHEWTHPAFKAEAVPPSSSRAASEEWLRELAGRIGISYSSMMQEIPTGNVFTGSHEFYDPCDSADIRRHYQAGTGVGVGEKIYFSCSC